MIPIVVNVTIFNTAPFWTTFLAWCMLGDRMNKCEVMSMIASFFCVIVIGMSSNVKTEEEPVLEVLEEAVVLEEVIEEEEEALLSGRVELLVGCLLMLLTAWGFSAVNVITRKM